MSIKSVAIFDKATGGIASIFIGPYAQVAAQLRPGFGVAPFDPNERPVSDTTHWVDQGGWSRKIREREPLSPELTINDYTATIVGLPPGLTAHVAGHEIETDGEPLVVTFDAPGSYQLTLGGIARYRELTMEITIDGND